MDSKKEFDAYNYYKTLHPSTVILFRVGCLYRPFFDDASVIARLMPEWTGQDEWAPEVPVEKALDFVAFAHCRGVQVRLVDHLNEEGDFDVPDIHDVFRNHEDDC